MSLRRAAAAVIFLFAAGPSGAQDGPRAVPEQAGKTETADAAPADGSSSGGARAAEAPAAPEDKAAAAAAPPNAAVIIEKKKAALNQDVLAKVVAAKTGDGQKAELLQKLAPAAAGGALPNSAAPAPGTANSASLHAPNAGVPGGADAAVAAPAASARSGRAMKRANTSAAVLRGGFQTDPNAALNGGTAPPGTSLGAPTGAKPASPGSNPAEPRTASDLLLASHTGFAASIQAQGFKVGPGPSGAPAVLAANGTPATPAEIARLASFLRTEPTALMHRPDFFSVLPRTRFDELKADYRANPSSPGPAFQDIGMTAAGRDFRWSASCGALQGGCNPVAGDKPYRKGEDVAPEDLNRVWKKMAADQKDDEEGMDDYSAADRKEIAAAELAEERLRGGGRRTGPSLAGILSGLGSMAEDARDFAGFGGRDASGPGGSADFAGAGSGPSGGPRSSASLAAGEARGLKEWTVPSPSIERKGSRRGAAGVLAGLAAAAFLLWRRRRSS